ncbi:hypothetical protein [Mesobacillus foraminis]|uniref:hypothetical protein n=1 Tax=Mesobacillus foraminis TaxID=279826 RepID=UPI000EF50755|nr:hypothetical protein [Mesobacillus foraminis]
MSLVSIIATDKFISLVTDGQVSSGYCSFGEGLPKYRDIIAGESFVAFTGNMKTCLNVAVAAQSYYKEMQSLKRVAETIQHNLSRAIGAGEVEVVIGGVEDGICQYHVFLNKRQVVSHYPSEGECLFYVNEVQSQLNTNQAMGYRLGRLKEKTLNKIQSVQTDLHKHISTFEPTVNNEQFSLIIEKG